MKLFCKSSILRRIFIVLLSVGVLFGSAACRSSKGQRHAYHMQKQSAREGAKDHEDLAKAHYERQSESSKRMMKEMEKENKKLKKNQKRSLWDRLFRKKCR